MAAELPVRITADLSDFNRGLGTAKGNADALGKSAGQAKEQMALVGAAAARISPALGNAVNSASAALGVIKSMTSAMGAVAGIAAVAGAAFVKASNDLDAAEVKANEAAKTAIKAQLGIVDANYYVNEAIETQEKVSVEKRKGYWRDWARSALDAVDTVAGVIPGVSTATDYYRKKLDELDAEQAANIATMEGHRDRLIELAGAQIEETKAAKERLKVAKDEHAAHAQYIEDLFQRRDEERALRDYEEQIEKDALDAEKERLAFTNDTIQAEMDASFAMYDAFLDQQAKERQIRAENTNYAIDSAQALGDAVVGISQAMFGDSKEAAIAGAIIDTAAGVAKALGAAPPPFNFINAAAVGIAGAAQVATIQSTNIAHSGLAFNPAPAMAPDEMAWKLRKNEGVLTERGVKGIGGYSQVRKLNAGQSPSMGSSFVGLTHWKHQTLDKTIGANIARPAAVRTEIKAIAQTGGRVGHRLRSNT